LVSSLPLIHSFIHFRFQKLKKTTKQNFSFLKNSRQKKRRNISIFFF